MAYIDWSKVKERDYSQPYKTFNDLENGNIIYLIDFRNLTIKDFIIDNYNKKENNTYKVINRFEVSFKLYDSHYVVIDDGNQYLSKVNINHQEEYITTDERIANLIIGLLKERNSYQWNSFVSLFGSPMHKYAMKDTILN